MNVSRRTILGIVFLSLVVGCMIPQVRDVIAKDDDDGESPWDRVWTAISELLSKVDGLNASLVDLLARIEALEDPMEPLVEVPFNGMTMSYRYYDNYYVQSGERFTTEITFYGNSSEPEYIWVTGFLGAISPFRLKIGVDTRARAKRFV